MNKEKEFTTLILQLEPVEFIGLARVLCIDIIDKENKTCRDFYDIFILHTLYSSNYDISVLSKALVQTAKRRGSAEILNSYQDIIKDMRINTKLQNLWKNYQYVYDYAKEIDFNDICDAILYIMDNIVEFL